MIKYIDLSITAQQYEKEISPLLKKVFLSGQFIGGEQVKEFEKNFAEYVGVKYAISVASGTDALILALKAVGIKEGDEVISVANSFISTANAIEFLGAKAVFVDIGDDLLMDYKQIEKAVTNKTKAIIPVHLMGLPCDMDEINEIAKKHNLYVIEDAAQSVGSVYKNKKTGSIGDIGCFSLHPLKNLRGIGDGGIITTNNYELAKKIRLLANNGLIDRDNQEIIGKVSRLDTVNAVILNERLKIIDFQIENMRKKAHYYISKLKNIDQIKLIEDSFEKFHSYHIFVIKALRRDELKKFLLQKGIETKIHYPKLISQQKPYKDSAFDIPNTEKLNSEILTLPLNNVSFKEIDYIAKCIKEFYKENNA